MKCSKLYCRHKFWFWFLGSLIIIAAAYLVLFKLPPAHSQATSFPHREGYFGVTYSKKFATELGLNWQETYSAILNDLGVKWIRLPIYWDDVEKVSGQYDFSDYDLMLQAGAAKQAGFVINIGQRLPRWPECHSPLWAKPLAIKDQQAEIMKYLKAAVLHFRDNPAVVYWQVENEPLLNTFGECPKSDIDFLKKEVILIRSLDSRPVIITGSGELSSWRRESRIGDLFGSTMYRVVWNNLMGYIHYHWPIYFYRFKADLARINPDRRLIMELQAEPWVPVGNMAQMTAAEYEQSMSLDQFKNNIQYAIKVDFQQTYLWGVEWWYFLKQKGQPQYWELAKTLFP